ncbi:MAG: SDR family NAD(P)-dependent oxidoreductase [Thermoleophilaceae bacterium]
MERRPRRGRRLRPRSGHSPGAREPRGGGAAVDRDGERAQELAESLKVRDGAGTAAAVGIAADVTDEAQLEAAVEAAVETLGELRLAVSCAGIGWAERVVGREGAATLAPFETVVRVNLIGTFNSCGSPRRP